jgi:adenylate kinase
MRIVLIGPPGSGKGTQGAVLSERFGLDHVSTGDMLRADTPAGRRCRAVIDAGGFVPDALALELVEERLSAPAASGGFVLDGYPRTARQAEDLDRLLARTGSGLDAVVELGVDPSILAGRILARADAARAAGLAPRADDTPGILASRLADYAGKTAPVLDFYRSSGRLLRVDGTLDRETVSALLADLVRPRAAA